MRTAAVILLAVILQLGKSYVAVGILFSHQLQCELGEVVQIVVTLELVQRITVVEQVQEQPQEEQVLLDILG